MIIMMIIMIIYLIVMGRVMMITMLMRVMMATCVRAGKLMQMSAGVFAGIRIGPSDASDFLRAA